MGRPVYRIVSLVPSLTETLVAYGLIDSLVGRTRYCTRPAAAVGKVAVVGGTKDPDIHKIVALQPDLVVINREENRLEDFHALEAAGLKVHVTHPRTLGQAISMLAELGRVCGAPEPGAELARQCQSALAGLSSERLQALAFCPLWRDPWMTFSGNTYVSDVLAVSGFANVFADAGPPTGPGKADFFEVSLAEIVRRQPEVVILPDEPYRFSRKHLDELRGAGMDAARFFLIDGKDLSWYGPRIPGALGRLSGLLRTK